MIRALLIALVGLCVAISAQAQGARATATPGKFDYYVLALSWSPSFCAVPEMANREPAQCQAKRPFAFIVHGLWPQYERGWPQDCPAKVARVAPAIVQKQLDIMPSPKLIEHQWDKHGACSGLDPAGYFDLTRTLRNRIITPPQFAQPTTTLMVTGAQVEQAFLKANPGLKPEAIAVTCDQRRIREVRICFTKDGRTRACGADVRDRCAPERRAMPPARGG
jgi:ribonuclease T2